jgi:hypothetical protein
MNNIIKFNGEQVDTASFPEKCPVYICSSNKKGDNVIINHGVVTSVFFQMRPQMKMLFNISIDIDSNADVDADVDVDADTTDADTTDAEEKSRAPNILEMIPEERLRLRNGCPVYMTRNFQSNNSDVADEKGVVLGIHDIPSDVPRTDREGYEWVFSYSIQLLDESGGTKSIEYDVFPSDLKFRNLEKEQDLRRGDERKETAYAETNLSHRSEERNTTREMVKIETVQGIEIIERYSAQQSKVNADLVLDQNRPAPSIFTEENDDVKNKSPLPEKVIKEASASACQRNNTKKNDDMISKLVVNLLQSDIVNDPAAGAKEKDDKSTSSMSISPFKSVDGHDDERICRWDDKADDRECDGQNPTGVHGEHQNKRKLSFSEDDKLGTALSSKRKISAYHRNTNHHAYFHRFAKRIVCFAEFVKLLREDIPPSPWGRRMPMCIRWHIKGSCSKDCRLVQDHRELSKSNEIALFRWCERNCNGEEKMVSERRHSVSSSRHFDRESPQHSSSPRNYSTNDSNNQIRPDHDKDSKTCNFSSDSTRARQLSTPRHNTNNISHEMRPESHTERTPKVNNDIVKNARYDYQLFSSFKKSKIKISTIRGMILKGEIPALPLSRANRGGSMCLSWHVKGVCNGLCSNRTDHTFCNKGQNHSLAQWCDRYYPLE